MRVIINDEFYEFQNERTAEIFNEQKIHLASLVEKHSQDDEYLLTALLSLNNLTEALIGQIVSEKGTLETVRVLKAQPLK